MRRKNSLPMLRIEEAWQLLLVVALIIVSCVTTTVAVQPSPDAASVHSPLVFTKNLGQWPDSVLFSANADGATMWFMRDGVYYQFTKPLANREAGGDRARMPGIDLADRGSRPVEIMMIKAEFIGANPAATLEAEGLLDYKSNYFIGNDPSKWAVNVPSYRAITLSGVYDGVNLRFSGNARGELIYEYQLDAEADANHIQLRYEGTDVVSTESGSPVSVDTEFGQISELLVAPASTGYSLAGDLTAGATGNKIAPSISTADSAGQADLVYSTYLGGSGDENGIGIDVDGLGCAYVTGYTYSIQFPAQNPWDSTLNGTRDVFVTKMSPDGGSLIFSTFLGGETDEGGEDIFVDESGCSYIIGWTWSHDFPVHNSYDDTHNPGDDVFITKLSANGDMLEYSTFLGGSGDDAGYAIAVDASGCAYAAGDTRSLDFPTQNAWDNTFGGYNDAFITKLSPAGTSLVYSTFLGGDARDEAKGIAIDQSGAAYITGFTRSSNFPTENAWDSTISTGDVFVTKLAATGNALTYSTYLGGSNDEGTDPSIDIDDSGCAYVTGYTWSSDFPTEAAYDSSHNGDRDAYVTKLSPAGDSLVYSTYYGGSSYEFGFGIAVDSQGFSYIGGWTGSYEYPEDIFVAKFSEAGDALVYNNYLSGSNGDHCYAMALDQAGSVYLTGCTYSPDFPVRNAYDSSHNGGGRDALVAKLSVEVQCLPTSAFSYTPAEIYVDSTVQFTDESTGDPMPDSWLWDFGDGDSSTEQSPVHVYTEAGEFVVTLIAENACGVDTVVDTLEVLENEPVDSLIIPSMDVMGCGADWQGVQRIQVKTSVPLYGAAIPIAVPSGVAVESVSTTGCETEGWMMPFDSITTEFVFVVLASGAQPSVEPGLHSILNLHYRLLDTLACGEEGLIHWDTTYSENPDWNLSFVDTGYNTIPAGFDYDRDSTNLSSFMPGDCDGSCSIDIADLVCLVSYMFQSGPDPHYYHAMDVAASGAVDIADLVKLVNWMFSGGASLDCGQPEFVPWPLPKPAQQGTAATRFDRGNTQVVYTSPAPLLGIQLELVGRGNGEPVSGLQNDNIEVVHGRKGDRMKVGILDMQGAYHIEAGEHVLLEIPGQWEIVSALAADQNFQTIQPTLGRIEPELPREFTLSQNYPNPFNPTTEINFALPTACDVSLEIYNIAGQRVTTLVDSYLEAGPHSVLWDASMNASGVYFYRLTAGEFTQTKKMMLLK